MSNFQDSLFSSVKPLTAPSSYYFTVTAGDQVAALSKGRWSVSVEGTGGTDYALCALGAAYTAQSTGVTPGVGFRVGAGFREIVEIPVAGATLHFTGSTTATINITKIA